MKITSYIAPGFSLDGDFLTFSTPSTNIGSESIHLEPDARKKLVADLQSDKYGHIKNNDGSMVEVRWLVRGMEGAMHWRFTGTAWEANVFLMEPLAKSLCGYL
jgi:hypothetical protein